ncbi:MAG: nucleoside deaminase [Clostridia bacterium]
MEEEFMMVAFKEAEKAFKKGEIPIGACVVKDGKVLAKAHNNREKSQNALNHAEMICIRAACKKLRSWRLDGCTLFVTLEPCPMCAGACLNARISKVVFGANESRSGFFGSVFDVSCKNILNHNIEVKSGVMQSECGDLVRKFFFERRK